MTTPLASSASPFASTVGGVSTDTSRTASPENLKAAGERFEAIFVGMMLKAMRAPKLAEGLLDSKASEQFRDMGDEKLAQSMAAHTPLGIGKAMTEFLSRSAGAPAAPANSAATDGSAS